MSRTLGFASLAFGSVLLVAVAACGGGGGSADASVDAPKPRDAGKDHVTHDAEAPHDAHAVTDAHDAGLPEKHYIDATVQCEGGPSWAPCDVTDAAELACEASTDCTWQTSGTCCGGLTFGVNKSAPPLACPAPPCGPPKTGEPACAQLITQGCQVVDASASVVAVCVDHRCVTRAASN